VMNALAKVQNRFLKIDIDKWARVVPSDQTIDSVNEENDISKVEYELVDHSHPKGGKGGRGGHKGSKGAKGGDKNAKEETKDTTEQ
jgi:hypothetical protein